MWIRKLAGALVLLVPWQCLAAEAKKIQDNSFLLEEAYNQEAGVVQHIQSFMYMKKSKDWSYSFTQEWPFPDETHQLSYTVPVVRLTEPANASGIGDLALNYRYQAILREGIAFSPRISVIVPTGDYKKGHGTGSTGIQANLPLSLELSDRLVTHWNLGVTHTARSKEPGGVTANTTGFNYGASLIFLSTENFNLMLEAAGTRSEVVQPDGSKLRERSFFINPGVRFARNYSSGLQVVPGISIPIGIGPSSGKYGVLFYLSLEHPFR